MTTVRTPQAETASPQSEPTTAHIPHRRRIAVPGRPSNWITVAVIVLMLIAAGPLSVYGFFPSLTTAGVWAPAVLGLVLLVGWTGQIALGQGALVAVAAYTAGYLSASHGVGFWTALAASLVLTLLMALVTGPILRVQGFYFALATLGLAMMTSQLISAFPSVTGGASGLTGIQSAQILGWEIGESLDMFYFAWGTTLGVCLLLFTLTSGRFGRALRTIGRDVNFAAGLGVPTFRYKLYVWLLSAGCAGVSGVLYAYYSRFLGPEQFTVDRSILLIAAVMIGGSTSPLGAVIGSILLFAGPQILGIDSNFTILATAILLIVASTARFTAPGRWLGELWRDRRRKRESAPDIPIRSATTAEGVRPQLTSPAEEILKVRNLAKRFGGVSVLEDVNLSVRAGTIQGLIGPNGAGKSTLLGCLTASIAIDSGTLEVEGDDVTRLSTDKLSRRGVVRTYQHPQLLPALTAFENVMLGTFPRSQRSALLTALLPWQRRRDERLARATALEALQLVDCGDLASHPASTLTVGQQRLIATAQALAAGPTLLCLDEPAAGLNPAETERLAECLRAINQIGVTVLLVEHHMDLVMSSCDSVAVLAGGRIIVNDHPDIVQSSDEVVSVYLGSKK